VAPRRVRRQRRQRRPAAQVVRRRDGAGDLVELLDEVAVGRRRAAGAAEGEEQPVVVNEPAAAEDAAGVQLEVVVLVADGAPVEDALVGRVLLAEHAVQRDRLPRAGLEHPGDVVLTAVWGADDGDGPTAPRAPGS